MWMESASPQVVLLVAPWFDEMACVMCLALLRQRRVAAVLIGLKPGPVKGKQGVRLHPDGVLNRRFIQRVKHKVLILPFGKACAAAALADPRVHQLAQKTLREDGLIALPKQIASLVQETSLLTPKNQHLFLEQLGEIRPFVERISSHTAS